MPSVRDDVQELSLQLQRQVADLVQQEGPAIGDFEEAWLVGHGAGERPGQVAEQLALDQLGLGVGARMTRCAPP